MSFTNNYSLKHHCEVCKNFIYLYARNKLYDQSLLLNYEININFNRLEIQAKTFALNFSGHGYINFHKVLRCDRNLVDRILFEVYIYSFAKALINGLNFHLLSFNSNLGIAFRGHVALFNLLVSPNNSTMKDDFMLQTNISTGTQIARTAVMLQLINRFPFLKEYKLYSMDALGTSPFFIQKYETYLNRLNEDFYSRGYVQRGSQGPQEKNNPKSKDVLHFENGAINILTMNSEEAKTILLFSNSPLTNAFTNSNDTKLYFVPVQNGYDLEFNPSFSFCRANFITLAKKGVNQSELNEYFKTINITGKQDHLVCSEVFTNTGIKCRNMPKTTPNSDVVMPIIDKLIEYLEKLGKDYVDKLIERIIDSEDEVDITETFNELIEEKKSK